MRQQALDAYLALADAFTGQPHEALRVLQAAIDIAPYAEPLYRAAMRLHAELGNPEGIHRLRHALVQRLEEIDAQPSTDTLALADHFVASLAAA